MVKIFIGTSANGEDEIAEKTLVYSLEKHSSEPLEIIFMRNKEDGFMGKFSAGKWATPFSDLRWAIPEYCDFKGRALYMDVDQLNLKDISLLYNIDLKGKAIACRPQRCCVMVMDCEKLKSFILPVSKIKEMPSYTYKAFGNLTAKKERTDIDARWNCMDGEGRAIDDIWHLHFTNMATQPWHPSWIKRPAKNHLRIDLVNLWTKYSEEALEHSNI